MYLFIFDTLISHIFFLFFVKTPTRDPTSKSSFSEIYSKKKKKISIQIIHISRDLILPFIVTQIFILQNDLLREKAPHGFFSYGLSRLCAIRLLQNTNNLRLNGIFMNE